MSSSLDFDLPASVKYDIACMEAFDIEREQECAGTDVNHYELMIAQLRAEVQQWKYQCNVQQNTISSLQQQLNIQQSSFDNKFNEFLVCANDYDKQKSEELESLKRQNDILCKENDELRVKMLEFDSRSNHTHSSPLSSVCMLTDSNSSKSSPNDLIMDYKQYTVQQLKSIRIRQQNIVYIVGLPVSLCNAKLLKSNRWFGKFGPISRICFNTSPKCVKANSIPTFVTYNSQRDALKAIQKMNLYCLSDGTRLKTNYGRTKYCPSFCEGQVCNNHKCKFLHQWALKFCISGTNILLICFILLCALIFREDIITQQEINDFNAIRAGPPSRFNKK